MNEKIKVILASIGGLAIIALLCFMIYRQYQLSEQQSRIESTMIAQKQLADGIVRAQSQYATKEDIEAFAKANNLNLSIIQKDLDKFRADIAAINIVTVTSTGQNKTDIPSTGTGTTNPAPLTCPDGTNCDPFGYQSKQQKLDVSEEFAASKIPFGTVGFSAWNAKPWSLDISPREYKVSTVIGLDENQRQIIYNKFSIKINEKSYDLPISSEVKQVYPSPQFHWWNPRLYLGVETGVTTAGKAELSPSLTVSLMSYGKYKNNPDFSFLHLGVGFLLTSKKPSLTFAPAMYNVGQHLPLMKNTYIGPLMHIDADKNAAFMLGLKVGL